VVADLKIGRICLFCGAPPQDKNNEHPLPRWLLELTGDPARVVSHGYNWKTGKLFEFSFDSFKFPSCSACNETYSLFEGKAKEVVVAICKKEAVSPDDYVLLLDWLDKVRVGLWLGHRYLQGATWPPSFTIDSRIGAKDRMVAVYTIGDHQFGLNVYGAESRVFHWKPSVFSLRVNNTLFLNASWDWMCGSRCGFPYPKLVRHSKTVHGALVLADFTQRQRVVHPVFPGLMKSCVTLCQPVVQREIDGSYSGVPRAMLIETLRNQWRDRPGMGPLFRQFNAETKRVNPGDPLIEFDSVSIHEANRAIDIATQAYSLQNESISKDTYLYEDGTPMSNREAFMSMLARINTRTMRSFRTTPQATYEQLMREAAERRRERRRKGV
jgi:hypothetical protein